MKKVILLTVLSVFLLGSESKAQRFNFVTSFGVTQQWDIPYNVQYSLDHQYLGYTWVHAQRLYNNRGGLFFEVILQRGDVFVRVSVDPYGQVMNRVVNYSYPLRNHVCSASCGFHSNYYVNNRSFCNSNYHHGHNHITYRPVVVNQHHYQHGNAYGHHKNKGHKKNYGHHNNDQYRPVNRRSGAVAHSNYQNSRLNSDRSRNDNHGYGRGHGDQDNGNSGKGYGRGDNKGNNGNGYGRGGNRGNNGNNGNAYGKGKGTGQGSSGLGRGRGDGSNYAQDDRSKRGSRTATSSRVAYRSR